MVALALYTAFTSSLIPTLISPDSSWLAFLHTIILIPGQQQGLVLAPVFRQAHVSLLVTGKSEELWNRRAGLQREQPTGPWPTLPGGETCLPTHFPGWSDSKRVEKEDKKRIWEVTVACHACLGPLSLVCSVSTQILLACTNLSWTRWNSSQKFCKKKNYFMSLIFVGEILIVGNISFQKVNVFLDRWSTVVAGWDGLGISRRGMIGMRC